MDSTQLDFTLHYERLIFKKGKNQIQKIFISILFAICKGSILFKNKNNLKKKTIWRFSSCCCILFSFFLSLFIIFNFFFFIFILIFISMHILNVFQILCDWKLCPNVTGFPLRGIWCEWSELWLGRWGRHPIYNNLTVHDFDISTIYELSVNKLKPIVDVSVHFSDPPPLSPHPPALTYHHTHSTTHPTRNVPKQDEERFVHSCTCVGARLYLYHIFGNK